jgi:GNAT superfamily N-acetyltransferase
MRRVKLAISPEFDEEMDRLRALGFPAEGWVDSASDEFDSVSRHVVAHCDGQLAAYVRLTPGIRNYFRTKFGSEVSLPLPGETADVSRSVVAPEHRGHCLFELILLECLLLAADAGYSYVVGSCRPGTGAHRTLANLGFEDVGQPIGTRYNYLELPLQPLALTVARSFSIWSPRRCATISRLAESGYIVEERRPKKGTEAVKSS